MNAPTTPAELAGNGQDVPLDAQPKKTMKERLARFMDMKAFTAKRVGKAQAEALAARRQIAMKRANAAIDFFKKPENRESLDRLIGARAAITAWNTRPDTQVTQSVDVREVLRRVVEWWEDYEGPMENHRYAAMAAIYTDARASLSSASDPREDGWQPIATAPKDGTRVLLWVTGPYRPGAIRGYWDPDRYAQKPRPFWTTDDERTTGKTARRMHQPTHWQPLPTPPSGADQ